MKELLESIVDEISEDELYNYQILHKFKESEEFFDTLIKSLKMSKSTITFKINLYKLLNKIPFTKTF